MVRILSISVLFFILSACSNQVKSTKKNNMSGTYTVVKGDSILAIANKYRMNQSELLRLNNIRDANKIYPGQVLKIKGSSKSSIKSTPIKSTPTKNTLEKNNQRITQTERNTPNASSNAASINVSASKILWKKPTLGQIVQTYNANLAGRKGIQYGGSISQNIYAAAKGTVVHASGGHPGYGQLIIIKHSANVYSTYGYLAEILVRDGQSIAQGALIGKMGQSIDKRSVLNFEIRVDGKTVNPSLYVK
ncbi:peptidoglycan-binding protein LysM [Gammaproteobacteria bacterium]|nr:peptidoglycan-binding protein LysM [Gammaproteobacteria bacterium]